MKRKLLLILTAATLLLFPNANFGQAPDLGAASGFALFTAAGAFNSTGASSVTGDVGTNAGAFSAFPPGTLYGAIHNADATSIAAATDVLAAYDYMNGLSGIVLPSATIGNGLILTPGVYFRGEASTLAGSLTLGKLNLDSEV